MELILVSDRKIKIMLTPLDMNRFDLSSETLERGDDHVRCAFREILDEARYRTGFSTTGDRLYIQYYPSKEGGCELFVTKLGRSTPSGGDLSACAAGYQTGLAEPESAAANERYRHVTAYAFPTVAVLLSVCRRLAVVPHNGDSAAWRGDDGNIYLFLFGMNGITRGICDPYSFLTEYGTPQNADSLLLYIQEHGNPICERDAVVTLAAF